MPSQGYFPFIIKIFFFVTFNVEAVDINRIIVAKMQVTYLFDMDKY